MRISQLSIAIDEMAPPPHGNAPWTRLPLSLILRTTNREVSQFDNRFAYNGRDNRQYIMLFNFITRDVDSVMGTISFQKLDGKMLIELSKMGLEPTGDNYYSATWLNVMIHGSGPCRIIVTGYAEK